MSETLAVRPCADEALLESLEHRLQLVRDRVRGEAEGYATGLHLWGEGDTSKSFTVEQTLSEAGRPYKVSNSRLTAKGLFCLLRDHPDLVHVLEDAETLFSDRAAFGVLRSALWGQPGAGGRQERLVVWQTAAGRDEVVFAGGLVLVANRPLDDVPELRALATRIPSLHYQPTNAEVAALMRQIARRGHAHDPHELRRPLRWRSTPSPPPSTAPATRGRAAPSRPPEPLDRGVGSGRLKRSGESPLQPRRPVTRHSVFDRAVGAGHRIRRRRRCPMTPPPDTHDTAQNCYTMAYFVLPPYVSEEAAAFIENLARSPTLGAV